MADPVPPSHWREGLAESSPFLFFGGAMLFLSWALLHEELGLRGSHVQLWSAALALGIIALVGGTVATFTSDEPADEPGTEEEEEGWIRVPLSEWRRVHERFRDSAELSSGPPTFEPAWERTRVNEGTGDHDGAPTARPEPLPIAGPVAAAPDQEVRSTVHGPEPAPDAPRFGSPSDPRQRFVPVPAGSHSSEESARGGGSSELAAAVAQATGPGEVPSPVAGAPDEASRILAELADLESRILPQTSDERRPADPSMQAEPPPTIESRIRPDDLATSHSAEVDTSQEGGISFPGESSEPPPVGGTVPFPFEPPLVLRRPGPSALPVVWEAAALRVAVTYGIRRREDETPTEYLDRAESELSDPDLAPARELDRLEALVDGLVRAHRHLATSTTYQLVGLFRSDLEELAEAIGLPKREYENPIEYAQRLREILSLVRRST